MELLALLSSGKGTWAQVSGLMKHGEWEKVIILGDEFAKQFTHDTPFEFDGKEHMALMSALINLPVGVRFAALTKDGVIDL